MTAIKRAQHLLETAGYGDLDLIRQCRADLMGKYAEAEHDYSVSFQRYELARPTKYLEIKGKKKDGSLDTKMSDMDIDRYSKKYALTNNDYIVLKGYVKVVHRYLDELRDLTIGLMHQAKDTL